MAYSSTETTLRRENTSRRSHLRRPATARDAFPDLEPAVAARKTGRLARIASAIGVQFTEIQSDPDARNPLSRVIVYGLNMALLFLAFPVGFAMLIFNVLGGESVRTTVHVLALTGFALVIAETEAGARLLGIG